jgi:hypothetical protein
MKLNKQTNRLNIRRSDMKKIFLITLAIMLVTVVVLPSIGYCNGYRGGYHGHHHNGNGWWIPGAILGGLFLGTALSNAVAPPVYYAAPPPPPPPPPRYYYYPPPPRVYVYPY